MPRHPSQSLLVGRSHEGNTERCWETHFLRCSGTAPQAYEGQTSSKILNRNFSTEQFAANTVGTLFILLRFGLNLLDLSVLSIRMFDLDFFDFHLRIRVRWLRSLVLVWKKSWL